MRQRLIEPPFQESPVETLSRVVSSRTSHSTIFQIGNKMINKPLRLTAILILCFGTLSSRAFAGRTVWNLSIFHRGLAPWKTTGSAWGLVDTPRPGRTVGPRPESQAGGEAATGTIRSPNFVVSGDIISFLANGWDGRWGGHGWNAYFLKRASDGKILRRAAPPQQDAFAPVSWLVSGWRGQTVYFEAVDEDNNRHGTGPGFAWLGFAHLRMIALDVPASRSHLFAIPLPSTKKVSPVIDSNGYAQAAGIPFILSGGGRMKSGGAWTIPLNQPVRRLFLAGFTGTWDQGEPAWGNPNGWRHILFIGQRMGTLLLDYADGQTARYPLIYGYSAWWGAPLAIAPEPFASSRTARRLLRHTLALRPLHGGGTAYLGVIAPRPVPIQDIRVQDNPKRAGVPIISGITVQPAGAPAPGWRPLPHDRPTSAAKRWLARHHLQVQAGQRRAVRAALGRLRRLLYTIPGDFPEHLPISVPADYHGPRVRFRGTVYADILTSVFYHDVHDILDKIDRNGMYHTSTPGAPEWWYTGVGTWRNGVGAYADMSWGRDLGRSLQEITELGFLAQANRVADYCFREARRWAADPSLKYKGVQLPPHWCRILNLPKPQLGAGVFENDAHGLIMLFTYKLWQRETHPRTWLRRHWKDIHAAGDWIGWQLNHPAVSGAKDGVLMTDSECAGGIGQAKYADFLCEEGLRAYAAMAASIGQMAVAKRWRVTADRLLHGIEKVYFTTDRWGPTWTLLPAGWPNRSTNLGPLITLADRRGFEPQANLPGWRLRDLNAYRRLISAYHPFGFYGTAMGYGQGFVTEAALLLDRMRDATTMLNWLAKAIYYPGCKPYLTPEGCQVQRQGRYWHRTGDLGNGVQEGETIKTLRLVIGVDDNWPRHTRLIPRLPIGWRRITVQHYPLLTLGKNNRSVLRHVNFVLQRQEGNLTWRFRADKPVALLRLRLGPFAESTVRVTVNHRRAIVRIQRSGDSYWVWLPAMRSVRKFQAVAWGGGPTLGDGRSGRW